MAEQIVTLESGESRVVSFEATPREAKTYQVSVNGLTGSFTATEEPSPIEPCHFYGWVKSTETMDYLAGVQIYADGKLIGETDATGRFDLYVEPGTFTVRLEHPRHTPREYGYIFEPGGVQRWGAYMYAI